MAMTDKQINDLITKIATQVVRNLVPDMTDKIVHTAIEKKLAFRSQLAIANPKSSIEVATKQSAGSGTYLPITGGSVTGPTNFQKVGFNGTPNISEPTVTGSRGGNAALASLLSALASYGLIIDASS